MLAPLMLFYVGAVLFLNGLWILGQVEDRELAIIDIFVGGLGLAVVLLTIIFSQGNLASAEFGSQILLFAFTYLWVAYNRYAKPDGRGLGWFCLFVAITAVPIGLTVLSTSGGRVWPVWLGLNWLAWAVLWFLFFLLLARRMTQLTKLTGWLTLLEGIVTGWIPGYLLLSGRLA